MFFGHQQWTLDPLAKNLQKIMFSKGLIVFRHKLWTPSREVTPGRLRTTTRRC